MTEPAPAAPAHWAADVVLADGGAAHVRPIRPDDVPLLRAFHGRLSSESIYLRFFSPRPKLSEKELRHFATVDHDARVALVVLLGGDLIAVGRYDRAPRSDAAEVAFVVADAQQGRGIATLLLERLASAAQERGITRFTADVLPQNRAMLHVFHDAGFEATSRFEDGIVRVGFPIGRTPEALAAAAARERSAAARSVERLLAPRGVGVVAEGPEGAAGEALLRRLEESGFAGPVRRLAASEPAGDFDGLDLVALAVPPDLLPAQIERCADRGVHAAVLLAGGRLSDEVASARGDLALAARARRDGLRLLGPGSLGVARLVGERPLEALSVPSRITPGRLGLFVESPSRGRDALEAAAARGVGLSTFLSAGRKADLSASDALQFWEEDTETRVVALLLRSLGNPRSSAAVARRVSRIKPVLVWLTDLPSPPPKGFVEALVAHTGVVRCRSLDDLVAVSAAFLSPRREVVAPDVAERILAWKRWRRAAAGRIVRPEGVDCATARRLVDVALAARPEGTLLAPGLAEALLARYGLPARAEGATSGLRVRIVQSSVWGSMLATERDGIVASRLVPLSEQDVRALAARGAEKRAAARADGLRRLATLAFDLPELAGLEVVLPDRAGEPLRIAPEGTRLAPWTLGLAFTEAGDADAPPAAGTA